MLDRLLRAHVEEARQSIADAMLAALDNEDLFYDVKAAAAKAKFFMDVISLLDRVKSGENIEYIATEHGVETST